MKDIIVNMEDLSDSRELMERKAPKAISIFISIVLSIIITLLIWSLLGEIDEYLQVGGEIRPQSSTNTITIMNGGKIKSIAFKDGDIVKAGDTILTLDIEAIEEQKRILNKNIADYDEKIKYNIQLKKCIEDEKNTFSKSEKEIGYYNQYEKYINDLKISLGQIYDANNQNSNLKEEAKFTLQSIDENIAKNNQLIQEYRNIIAAVENDSSFLSSNNTLISYYNSYIQTYNSLVVKISEYETYYEALKPQTNDEAIQIQIEEIEAQLDLLKDDQTSLKNSFILEVNQKIDSLKSDIESLQDTKEKTNLSLKNFDSSTSEAQVKEQVKLNMMVAIDNAISSLEGAKLENEMQLLSINDTIDNSKVTSEISGQIVFYNELSAGNTIQSGEQIAKIVPINNDFRTILYISNADISNVKVGQKVEYTVSSISSADYGKLYGKITSISADSFVDEASGTTYYKAEGTIDSSSVSSLSGETKYLKSGMSVEAHIVSGSKKLIIWFLEQLNFIN